jgi:hypothetical protein
MLKILAIAAAAVAVATTASGARTPVRLLGVVGPNNENRITLSTSAGRPVKTLHAGRYVIAVDDEATIHDFHIWGPSVDKTTGVEWKGRATWKVTLRPGLYHVLCDPHARVMAFTFTVSR